MLSTVSNTALILFTRTPQEEIAHKKILNRPKAAHQKQIFKFLVQHAQQLGAQTMLPFYVVDSNHQQGKTFGERLQHVFTTFFDQGFAKVIVIGNDCVQLSAADIVEASHKLQTHKAVFGPAQDGGVYLLGLDQALPTHQPGFTQINWQTTTVLSELQNWSQDTPIYILPKVYADLDHSRDVRKAFVAKQMPDKLLKLLANFFRTSSRQNARLSIRIITPFTLSYYFRGPPVY